jgi:DNA-binding GntR family transcriptional regulator
MTQQLDRPAGTQELPVTVVDRLRNDIVSGALPAGMPLRASALATRYQVSSVPVREALQLLSGEGLVVIERNKGARVRKLTLETVAHVCDVMEATESYFSRRFAEMASPFQIDTLNQIEDRHEALLYSEDLAALSQANKAFHGYLCTACNSPMAEMVWRRHGRLLGNLRQSVGFGEVRRSALSREHREIVIAARKGDRDRAGRVAELHARSSRDDLVERLREAGYR